MFRFNFNTFPFQDKTVLLRVDLNLPFEKNKITDDYKLIKSLPTIKKLLEQNAKIIIISHRGQPHGHLDPSLSLAPFAKSLRSHFPKIKIEFCKETIGEKVKSKIKKLPQKSILLLENLRFYKQEEDNNPIFAHSLAALADVYVNDAFAVSHRNHASLEAITHFIPSVAGIQLEQEIKYLHRALNPKRPAVWILGGAKLDKVQLIRKALEKADYLLLGGALAFPFLKAQGIRVGASLCDQKSLQTAKKILNSKNAKKIIFPLDFLCSSKMSPSATTTTVKFNQINSDQIALDLGPATIELYKRYCRKAHTIVWNGPLGYYEWAKFATATREIGRTLTNLTATTIVGGGETAHAMHKFHLESKLTHISTGGGASIAFLQGKILPGILALSKNYSHFSKQPGHAHR